MDLIFNMPHEHPVEGLKGVRTCVGDAEHPWTGTAGLVAGFARVAKRGFSQNARRE
jgi:hypothetical protein